MGALPCYREINGHRTVITFRGDTAHQTPCRNPVPVSKLPHDICTMLFLGSCSFWSRWVDPPKPVVQVVKPVLPVQVQYRLQCVPSVDSCVRLPELGAADQVPSTCVLHNEFCVSSAQEPQVAVSGVRFISAVQAPPPPLKKVYIALLDTKPCSS
jgi:hypothetical protein